MLPTLTKQLKVLLELLEKVSLYYVMPDIMEQVQQFVKQIANLLLLFAHVVLQEGTTKIQDRHYVKIVMKEDIVLARVPEKLSTIHHMIVACLPPVVTF